MLALSCAPAAKGTPLADRHLLVSPLPACYILHFDSSPRPEPDNGVLPDTLTLTRPFWKDDLQAEGYTYAGVLADSVLPRSDGMANVFGRPAAGSWTATQDSLLLSFGAITVVSVHLGPRPQGVWYQYADLGYERTGTLRATRIACRDR